MGSRHISKPLCVLIASICAVATTALLHTDCRAQAYSDDPTASKLYADAKIEMDKGNYQEGLRKIQILRDYESKNSSAMQKKSLDALNKVKQSFDEMDHMQKVSEQESAANIPALIQNLESCKKNKGSVSRQTADAYVSLARAYEQRQQKKAAEQQFVSGLAIYAKLDHKDRLVRIGHSSAAYGYYVLLNEQGRKTEALKWYQQSVDNSK